MAGEWGVWGEGSVGADVFEAFGEVGGVLVGVFEEAGPEGGVVG